MQAARTELLEKLGQPSTEITPISASPSFWSMPSRALRVPVRRAGQLPQAPPWERHPDHDLLLGAVHRFRAAAGNPRSKLLRR